MVSRPTMQQRAYTVWQPGTVPYSMSAYHQPDGYRQDCSGYVSMCWMLPSSEDTVSLVTEGWMKQINPADLLPGDAIGLCGPGTYGANGHIQFVDSYNPANGNVVIWEQAGGTYGPRKRSLKGIPSGYRAYRPSVVDGGGEDEDMTPDQARQLADVWSALFEEGYLTDRPRNSLIGLVGFPSDGVNLILSGASRLGTASSDPDPQISDHVPGRDLASVERRLTNLIQQAPTGGGLDPEAVATQVASQLASDKNFLAALASAVATEHAKRLTN